MKMSRKLDPSSEGIALIESEGGVEPMISRPLEGNSVGEGG